MVVNEYLFNLIVHYARTPIEKREIQLTDSERVILENLEEEEEWEWVARNESGALCIYVYSPTKMHPRWDGAITARLPYKDMFRFIEWSDEEPYNIKELLK